LRKPSRLFHHCLCESHRICSRPPSGHHGHAPSFPTRRSSDLSRPRPVSRSPKPPTARSRPSASGCSRPGCWRSKPPPCCSPSPSPVPSPWRTSVEGGRSESDAHAFSSFRSPRTPRGGPMTDWYMLLAAALSTIWAMGILVRRNALVMFMCVELMLNAVNLTLVSAGRALGSLDGQLATFFVLVVAAAEVVIGLAIIVAIFRHRDTASVDELSELKG